MPDPFDLEIVLEWADRWWPPKIADWLIGLATLIAALPVLGAIALIVSQPLRRVVNWLLRPRMLARQVRRLACGMQLQYFEQTLGQPAQYVNHLHGGYEEHIFVLPDAYVQAVANEQGRVGLFSVTTRSRRFRPRLSYYPSANHPDVRPVRLGRTPFNRLARDPLQGVHGWFGAHRHGYAEVYYFGNPGHYQWYLFALNESGTLRGMQHWSRGVAARYGWFRSSDRPAVGADDREILDIDSWLRSRPVEKFRSAAGINTISVMSDEFVTYASTPLTVVGQRRSIWEFRRPRFRQAADVAWEIGVAIGPDLDQVRTFPVSRFRRLKAASAWLSRSRPVGTTVAIAVGGAVGALARYGVAVAVPHADGTFPVATFVTNVAGCLLIGVLMAVVERGRAPDWARPALGVGVLGGFTTFSAYALELTGVLDRPVVALSYLFGTLVAALAATWVGLAGARRLLR